MTEPRGAVRVCGITHIKATVGPMWWNDIEETMCDRCGKMTPCHTYQGHFICSVCGNPTGFYVDAPLPSGITLKVREPSKWSTLGPWLETVSYTRRKSP